MNYHNPKIICQSYKKQINNYNNIFLILITKFIKSSKKDNPSIFKLISLIFIWYKDNLKKLKRNSNILHVNKKLLLFSKLLLGCKNNVKYSDSKH